MNKVYAVYISTNSNDKVMYVGVTSNLQKRIYEHKNKLIEGFTKKYNISKLKPRSAVIAFNINKVYDKNFKTYYQHKLKNTFLWFWGGFSG